MKFFMSSEVDVEIADFFREVRKEFETKLKILDGKTYGSEVEEIGIIPIVVNLTPELEAAGFYKERIKFSKKNKDADIRLRIDFTKFKNGSVETRKLMLLANVIKSVKVLSEKAVKDYNYTDLQRDILELFEVSIEEIEEYLL